MINNILLEMCQECSVRGMDIKDFVTIAISIITFFLNILFYIIIAPRISFRFQKKDELFKTASEFLTFLSEINSYDSFDGIPTKVKKYCVSIKLLFKDGETPEELTNCMEKVYQMVKSRKNIETIEDIERWETDFREETHTLRKELAKYTGIF